MVLLSGLPLMAHPLAPSLSVRFKVELAFVLTGILVATAPGCVCSQRGARWVYRALALYLVMRWASMVFSIAPAWSLWGDPFWGNGLWLSLMGAVLFWLAARYFQTTARRVSVVQGLVVASAFVAGYGVLQVVGFNPLSLRQDGPRVASTLGHPGFLGGYLALMMPLTLYLQARPGVTRRRLWQGIIVLQVGALFFSYARAGWLAAGAGLVAWFGLRLWTAGRRREVLGVGLALGIISLALFGLSLLPPLQADAQFGLQTITSMFRWDGATARIRLLGWEAAWDAFQARPWLGHGPATFRTVLEWHMPSEFAPFDAEATLAGRTHNVWLEMLVESGMVGLGAFVALLVALAVPVFRRAVERDTPAERRLFAQAVCALMAAWTVNLQWSFECPEMVVIFWAVLGMAHSGALASSTRRVVSTTQAHIWHRVGRCAAVGLGCCVAMLLAVSDHASWYADRLIMDGRWSQAVQVLEDATPLAPVPDMLLLDLGRVYAWWAIEPHVDPGEAAQHWDQAVRTYEKLLARRGDIAEYQMRYANVLHQRYVVERDSHAAQQALVAYSAAIQWSPRNPNHWLDRGLLQLDMGDTAGALADFQQAEHLLPGYARYYGAMVIYAHMIGDAAAAEQWTQQQEEALAAWDDWVWRR